MLPAAANFGAVVIKSNLPAIAAEVTPWSAIGPRDRRLICSDADWQVQARTYAREGPGIFGSALDIAAAASSLLRLVIRRRTPNGWVEVTDDQHLTAVLALWAGRSSDQMQMFSNLVRSLDMVGEAYMVLHHQPGRGRLHWQLAQTTNVSDNRDGTSSIVTRPGARPGDRGHKIVPDNQVFHVWTPDLEWEDEPWSPMRRAIPHISDYRLVMRNIGRNLRSQLAVNGIVWSKADEHGIEWQDQLRGWAQRAFQSHDGVEAVMPFAMSTTEKPEWIDIGRGDHGDQIEVAQMFLKSFAQSIDLPTNLVIEGPGQGNHWSSYLENDWFAEVSMGPRWQRACQIITDTHLRPLLRALGARFGYNADDFQVWADDSALRGKTDNADRILSLWDRGLIDDAVLATSFGLTADDLRDYPPGVTSYENWLTTRNPALAGNAGFGPTVTGGDEELDEDPNRLVPGVTTGFDGPPDRPDDGPMSAAVDVRNELQAEWANRSGWDTELIDL